MYTQPARLAVLLTTLIALAMAFPLARAGDSGSISGRLLDAVTGQPLALVLVVLAENGRQVLTDANGEFTIQEVAPGTYTIRVLIDRRLSHIERNVKVEGGKATHLSLSLAPGNEAKPELKARELPAAGAQDEVRQPDVDRSSAVYDRSPGVHQFGLAGPSHYALPPDFSTEEYSRIYENRFLDVVGNPLSTFSIDVDAASYANVRRFLGQGQLPPLDAVRTEELINYFVYDYPEPDDGHPFAISLEAGNCPWNRLHRLVQIGLQGRNLDVESLPPNNLVFLIDVSGSMRSPDKLPLLKGAFRLLVEQLRPEDRVAIVVYAGAAGLVLPSTPGSRRCDIAAAIDRLEAGGSTAGAAGIQLAYRVARENFSRGGNNRIILATDGDFNIGVSSTSDLLRMIEQKRESGIFLSVLGFGTGNLKDGRMEQLADKGNGNYNYIDNIREARKVLVSQMGGTLVTIAKDVKIQVEFNPACVKAYRLVGYENRLLAKEDFNDDRKDAGELGLGHAVTALYEIVPADGAFTPADVDPLKYQTQGIRPEARGTAELLTVKFRYKEPAGEQSRLLTRILPDTGIRDPDPSDNFRFAAAVAEFGMLLSGSEFIADGSYDQVLTLALGALGTDLGGYRHEFVDQARVAQTLSRSVAEN